MPYLLSYKGCVRGINRRNMSSKLKSIMSRKDVIISNFNYHLLCLFTNLKNVPLTEQSVKSFFFQILVPFSIQIVQCPDQ